MRRTLTLALLIVWGHALVQAQTDPLSPLRFLIGDWQAIDTPPGESGAFAFKLAVQDRIIVRTNEAVYAATAERAASRHDDLLVIYSEKGSLKAHGASSGRFAGAPRARRNSTICAALVRAAQASGVDLDRTPLRAPPAAGRFPSRASTAQGW